MRTRQFDSVWVTAAATVVTGVSAGFFYAYADSVTRGLAAVDDPTYVAAFQSINELVRTPLFMVVFAGPLVLLAVAAVASRRRHPARVLLIAALVAYAGVVAVTMGGNVPLNEQLATITATDPASLAAAREAFEGRWNTLNLIRTLLAAGAFAGAVTALAADGRPRRPVRQHFRPAGERSEVAELRANAPLGDLNRRLRAQTD